MLRIEMADGLVEHLGRDLVGRSPVAVAEIAGLAFASATSSAMDFAGNEG